MERSPEKAALVRQKAAEPCPGDCFQYHGIGPRLRLFGMVGGPGGTKNFFLDALAGADRKKPLSPRILISGTSDDSMYVLARRAVPDAAITVLDRCPVPLDPCRQRAHEFSEFVATVLSDIFGYTPPGHLHIVCSDAYGVLLSIPLGMTGLGQLGCPPIRSR